MAGTETNIDAWGYAAGNKDLTRIINLPVQKVSLGINLKLVLYLLKTWFLAVKRTRVKLHSKLKSKQHG